jgi:hypothetical protein
MATSNNRQQGSDTIDLIDIVFTAIVTIGLTPEVLQVQHITGMLSEPWVKAALEGKPIAPTAPEFLHLGVFLVGLLTLLLSWFGIHASLRANPIRYDSVWGMLRFILDVMLVLLYGVILVFFRQLQTVLFLLALVYILYVVWDLFKTFEYRDKYWNSEVHRENRRMLEHWGNWIPGFFVTFRRQFVSLLFAVSFVALRLLWNPTRVWTALALVLALTVLYRVTKTFPIQGSVAALGAWLVLSLVSCIFHV